MLCSADKQATRRSSTLLLVFQNSLIWALFWKENKVLSVWITVTHTHSLLSLIFPCWHVIEHSLINFWQVFVYSILVTFLSNRHLCLIYLNMKLTCWCAGVLFLQTRSVFMNWVQCWSIEVSVPIQATTLRMWRMLVQVTGTNLMMRKLKRWKARSSNLVSRRTLVSSRENNVVQFHKWHYSTKPR